MLLKLGMNFEAYDAIPRKLLTALTDVGRFAVLMASNLFVSSDVIVFGKILIEHDRALQALFQKFAEVSLNLLRSI